ncbi:MAG: hypothetical protein L0Z53_08125, partial [Acidobacteriales bacterium]|nr:hypothetical protein [Terriglobales bacterium]
GMLRKHLGRILLYEAMAVTLGAILVAPLLAPILLAALTPFGDNGLMTLTGTTTLSVFAGVALTPLLTYLFVANLHIYLNLRYEFLPSSR